MAVWVGFSRQEGEEMKGTWGEGDGLARNRRARKEACQQLPEIEERLGNVGQSLKAA